MQTEHIELVEGTNYNCNVTIDENNNLFVERINDEERYYFTYVVVDNESGTRIEHTWDSKDSDIDGKIKKWIKECREELAFSKLMRDIMESQEQDRRYKVSKYLQIGERGDFITLAPKGNRYDSNINSNY